jgi:hypothetical protein
LSKLKNLKKICELGKKSNDKIVYEKVHRKTKKFPQYSNYFKYDCQERNNIEIMLNMIAKISHQTFFATSLLKAI